MKLLVCMLVQIYIVKALEDFVEDEDCTNIGIGLKEGGGEYEEKTQTSRYATRSRKSRKT